MLINTTNNRFFACLGLLLAGCAAPDLPPPPLAPREVVTLGKWRVESDGHELGQVVKLEIRDPTGPVRFYRIEDRHGRWLGYASANGRFTRRVMDRDEDLGVLAMPKGCALLFESETPVDLVAVPVEAVMKKSQR